LPSVSADPDNIPVRAAIKVNSTLQQLLVEVQTTAAIVIQKLLVFDLNSRNITLWHGGTKKD